MFFAATVTPPPAPVAQSQIKFSVRFLLVRGDGHAKLLESLYDTKAAWQPPGSVALNGLGGGNTCPEIVIPLDLFTALRLGLIQESELALPEGVKALLNMIK